MAVIAEPGVLDAWGAAHSLATALGTGAFNVGDLCRSAIRRETAWGRRFERHVRAGELIPDEALADFLAENLAGSREGWVLFGHPSTVRRAELLAERGCAPGTVVEVLLDERQLRSDWRLAERQRHYRDRLAEHRSSMAPVRAYLGRTATVRAVRQPASFTQLVADLRSAVEARAGGGPPE